LWLVFRWFLRCRFSATPATSAVQFAVGLPLLNHRGPREHKGQKKQISHQSSSGADDHWWLISL
jgi:hypothetical protein